MFTEDASLLCVSPSAEHSPAMTYDPGADYHGRGIQKITPPYRITAILPASAPEGRSPSGPMISSDTRVPQHGKWPARPGWNGSRRRCWLDDENCGAAASLDGGPSGRCALSSWGPSTCRNRHLGSKMWLKGRYMPSETFWNVLPSQDL